MKKIILCITGSIAAVRSYELIRTFQSDGYEVQCIVSNGGEKFISRLALESLSGFPVLGPDIFTFEYPQDPSEKITKELYAHIEITKDVEGIVIAPASADFISDYAHGKANDFLLAMLLANTKPVLLAPAMNTQMWNSQAVQNNIETLQSRNVSIVSPQSNGVLACGDEGAGKMEELSVVVLVYRKMISPQSLKGKTILINTGGTKEFLDPVRYIGNESSGMTGRILAEECFVLGAEKVRVVAGNVQVSFLENNKIYEIEKVSTGEEMKNAMQQYFAKSDVCIFAAAVADYSPVQYSETKLKKNNSETTLLHLEKTLDIAQFFAQQKTPTQKFVGFALETEKDETLLKKIIEEKAKRKGFNIVFGNSPSSFNSDQTEFLVYNAINSQWEKRGGEKRVVFREVLAGVFM